MPTLAERTPCREGTRGTRPPKSTRSSCTKSTGEPTSHSRPPMSTTEHAQAQPHTGVGKIAEVPFWFWVIKIAATTLGETGGDAVTMSMNLGYLAGTAIFATLF